MADQLELFQDPPAFPQGFRFQREFIPLEAERSLLEQFRALPFRDFEFHGFTGKRRTVSFGWAYDFGREELRKADEMPPFLLPLREAAAGFAGLAAEALQQVLVTEYGPGASIGWHRDKAVFAAVVGVSLLSSCHFRLRRKRGEEWERVTITAEPRSAYLLAGAARTEWEHSIPAVDTLRYSVTFRSMRWREKDS
jgi:alkylated DNA repair dioxygenase AlkB